MEIEVRAHGWVILNGLKWLTARLRGQPSRFCLNWSWAGQFAERCLGSRTCVSTHSRRRSTRHLWLKLRLCKYRPFVRGLPNGVTNDPCSALGRSAYFDRYGTCPNCYRLRHRPAPDFL